MTLTREEWKTVIGCRPERPITGTRPNLAHPYVFRNASDQTVSESMVLKLVNKGVIAGKVQQVGLSPDIHYLLTDRGEIAYAEAEKKFDKKSKRDRGAG